MTQEEIKYNIRIHAAYAKKDPSCFRAIPKSEMIVDKEYEGHCRNSGKAVWKGDHFEYQRYKLGSYYTDEINHYEDDDGYDVFVPTEEIKQDENDQ